VIVGTRIAGMSLRAKTLVPLLLALVCTAPRAGVLLEPTPAPEWKVSQWINGDPGALSTQRGKIVVIHFFQMWCPGCNEFSIPLFQSWQEQFADRDDILFVSIHTVFEGHAQQTPENLKRFVAERGMTQPVGIDAYPAPDALVPITMDRYETGGTPHVAIVDKQGELRFSHFGRFDPLPVERFLTRLFDEDKKFGIKSTPRDKPPQSRTAPRKGGARRPPPPDPPAEPPPEQISEDFGAEQALPDGEAPVPAEPDAVEPAREQPEVPDASLSGSYKLRFEVSSTSCGTVGPPIEVITQVTVQPNRMVARFSRPFLGIRELTVNYNEAGGDFRAEVRTKGTELGGTQVDVSLQMSGRFVSSNDPVEVEFEFYVDERSADGTHDCVIEGRGGGGLFRGR